MYRHRQTRTSPISVTPHGQKATLVTHLWGNSGTVSLAALLEEDSNSRLVMCHHFHRLLCALRRVHVDIKATDTYTCLAHTAMSLWVYGALLLIYLTVNGHLCYAFNHIKNRKNKILNVKTVSYNWYICVISTTHGHPTCLSFFARI